MEFIRRRREDLTTRPTTNERIESRSIPTAHDVSRPPIDQPYSENPKYDYSAIRPLRPLTDEELRKPRIRELLNQISEEQKHGLQRADTEKKKKPFKWPGGWKSKANKASKKRDFIMIWYLNIKGEIEQPLVVPIYSGNMVIIRNKIHEVDPRAMWNWKVGMKTHKVLIVREIDRRPVTNLDLDEVRKRGDATDSDEFLIKAAIRAQTAATAKPIPMWVWIVVGIIVIGLLIFFFTQGGGGAATPKP
jgi:hypothetical protein